MRLTLFLISLILIAAKSNAKDTLLLGHTIPEIVFEDEKEEGAPLHASTNHLC